MGQITAGTAGFARGTREVLWGLLLVLLVLCPIGLVGGARPANADPTEGVDGSEGREDLFAELLASEGDGEWRGILNRIRSEMDAAWIGQVLGSLFRDRVRHADKAACAAYTAAYLADHPEGDSVLLGEAIVRRAHGDTAFLTALRSHITKGEGGWPRLLDHARALLEGEDLGARRAAVFVLSHESGDQRERVRRELEARAVADLPSLQGPNGAHAALAREYLDAFERCLGFRFATVDEAVATLGDLRDRDLPGLLLVLSRRKDRPDAPDHKKLVEYGKRLVDAVAKGRSADALEEFLDPVRTAYPSLRRYAMQKAAQMEPAADAAWGQVLRLVLAREEDPDVLKGALTLLERTGFAEAPEEAARLAVSIAARLEHRGPAAGGAVDALPERVRMARMLGTLGAGEVEVGTLAPGAHELGNLLTKAEALEPEVLAELLRARGAVQDVTAEEVLRHYRRASQGTDRDRLVRTAVVDALGRPGFREAGEQSELAAAALREVLTGEGEARLGRAEDSTIRQHAIRALLDHAGPETAVVLRDAVSGVDEAEAQVALVVLGKTSLANADAAGALGELVALASLAPARRIAALQTLAALDKATPASREHAAVAARAVLASEAPEEVRLEAAATATALADPEALAVLLAWWRSDPKDDVSSVLGALVQAVARATEDEDARVVATILGIGEGGDWDLAVDLATSIAKQAGRPPWRLARARVLFERASEESRDAEARRQDLATADRILDSVLGAQPGPTLRSLLGLHVRVLRAAGELAEDDAERKVHYLAAVRRATASPDEPIVRLGLEAADRLDTEPLKSSLDEAEAARLVEDRKALQAKLP